MEGLEEMVGKRTLELTRANEKLQAEIVGRQAAENRSDSAKVNREI
jgi:C4-dicarboxylate-specific signal transduction histidine kinase